MAEDTTLIRLEVTGNKQLARVLDKAAKDVKKFSADSEKNVKGLAGAFGRVTSNLKGVGLALGGVTLAGFALQRTVSSLIDASNMFENALLGLGSIAESTGQDIEAVNQAARDLAEDGLMTVADSAAALKNLLIRGFGLNEAVMLMNAFRDSAAFARQGALTFGTAIVRATEGLKNELSILVDNAGITKNLSLIWRDYAENIGVGARSLTLAQKRQAELTGILKEAAPFTGDAIRLTKIYSGATAALSAAFLKTKAALGDQLKPELAGFVFDIRVALDEFRRFVQENEVLISALVKLATLPVKVIGELAREIAETGNEVTNTIKQMNAGLNETVRSLAGVEEKISIFGVGIDRVNSDIQSMALALRIVKDAGDEISFDRLTNEIIKLQKQRAAFFGFKPEVGAEAEVIEIDKKTLKIRERLALDNFALIAKGEEDLSIKKQLLFSLEVAKFAQSTKDKLAINAFANQLFLEQQLDFQAKSEAFSGKHQEILGQQIVDAELKRIKGQNQEIIGAEIVAQAKSKLLKKQAEDQAKSNKDARASTISFLTQQASLVANESRALFRINQAFSITNAIMNTLEAKTKALAAFPPPFNFAAAAAVGAFGFAQVAAIASSSFGGGSAGAGGGGGGGGGGIVTTPVQGPQAPEPAPAQAPIQNFSLIINNKIQDEDFPEIARELLPLTVEVLRDLN